MNRKNLTGIAAAIAFAGILPACGCPMAEGAANSPATANAAPDENAAGPTAADTSAAATAPTAAAAPGTTAAAPGTPGASAGAAPAAPPGAAAAANGGAAAAAPAAAAAAPAAGTGTISGQVTAMPAKLGKHIVVWLDGGGLPAKPVTTEIDQKNMKFLPLLTAIPAGGKVIFRNSDPFPHNVFSSDGDKFNLGMMPANAARIHVFKKPGAYTLLCQIHPGMIAYVYVVPSKFYAVADNKGDYTIKDVPNGSYKLSAWAPKLAVSTTNVTVSGGTATASLQLHRGN